MQAQVSHGAFAFNFSIYSEAAMYQLKRDWLQWKWEQMYQFGGMATTEDYRMKASNDES